MHVDEKSNIWTNTCMMIVANKSGENYLRFLPCNGPETNTPFKLLRGHKNKRIIVIITFRYTTFVAIFLKSHLF